MSPDLSQPAAPAGETRPMTQAEALREVFKLFPFIFVGFMLVFAVIFGPLFLYLWKQNPKMFAPPVTHTASVASVTLDAGNYITSMQFSDATGTYRCGHGYHGIVCEKATPTPASKTGRQANGTWTP
jgi:hypothetical protein